MNLSDRLKQASRVVRTLHQGLLAVLPTALLLVAVLGVPATTVAAVLAVMVPVLTAVAKVYNLVFPAEPPLDEDPLN
jgi:hypothetical protein